MNSNHLTGVAIALFALPLTTSCEPSRCDAMRTCCEAAERDALPGLGDACGPLARDADDPETCSIVTETIRILYEKNSLAVPGACASSDAEGARR